MKLKKVLVILALGVAVSVCFAGCYHLFIVEKHFEEGASLQLKLEGVLVQIDANKDDIIEQEFNDLLNDSVTITDSTDGAVTFITKKPVPKDVIDSFAFDYGGEYTINDSQVTLKVTKEKVVSSFLGNKLGAEVVPVFYNGTEMYEIRKNVSLECINSLLAQVNGTIALEHGKTAFIEGVSPETMDTVKQIIERRFAILGYRGVKVYEQNGFIILDLAGVSPSEAKDIFGEPSKFEIRIKTDVAKDIKMSEDVDKIKGITKHALYGDDIESVAINPQKIDDAWGVIFSLSDEGADKFREAAIRYGVVKNPLSHEVVMLLNDKVIYFAPFSPELADEIKDKPIYNLVIGTGTGDTGYKHAMELIIHLKAGALPVNVKIVRSVELYLHEG